MGASPKANGGNGDINPPHPPHEIDPSFATKTIILIDNADGNAEDGGRTHRVTRIEKTVPRMP